MLRTILARGKAPHVLRSMMPKRISRLLPKAVWALDTEQGREVPVEALGQSANVLNLYDGFMSICN